jgi:hypothetical protein
MAWQGWLKSVRPLITGMLAHSAMRSTMSWAKVRIMMPCTMRSRFLATSYTDSRLPRLISAGDR